MMPTGTSRSHDVIHSIRSGFRDAAAGQVHLLVFLIFLQKCRRLEEKDYQIKNGYKTYAKIVNS